MEKYRDYEMSKVTMGNMGMYKKVLGHVEKKIKHHAIDVARCRWSAMLWMHQKTPWLCKKEKKIYNKRRNPLLLILLQCSSLRRINPVPGRQIFESAIKNRTESEILMLLPEHQFRRWSRGHGTQRRIFNL